MPDRPPDREEQFLARFARAVPHILAMRAFRAMGDDPHPRAHLRRLGSIAVVVAAASLLGAGLWGLRRAWHPSLATGPAAAGSAIALVQSAASAAHDEARSPVAPVAPLAGLDLAKIAYDASGPVAPVGAGTARLTLDAELQRTALGLMSAHHLPEGAVVLMDVATGHLLVYASHVDKGPARDLCAEATAPSASVFKIVTAAALFEDAHVGPDAQECYSGGESRINAADLARDPRRDRWCTTLAGALGRSINTVFARLASERLAPTQLEAMARRFGYGQVVAFDAPVQASELHVPTETLEFARTAAGFWNSTLSPVQAAEMSAVVARGGDGVRPSIVGEVVSPAGAVVWSSPDEPQVHHVVARETAEALATMMGHTVSEGTSWRAFHDPHGKPFLPGIEVAGKTGTLTDGEQHRYYTWFTGFAPAHPGPGIRQVAVAALVVNGPQWQVKANVIARDVLRSYFASQGAEGVTHPSLASVARHPRK
jgi:penicillin-binding protein A